MGDLRAVAHFVNTLIRKYWQVALLNHEKPVIYNLQDLKLIENR